ncbi:MAG: hypothetical protein JRI68_21855 [Deltaproteobacteria bacterium]|nr:hypothetical protein [Deltaproteobacteria bacterium]
MDEVTWAAVEKALVDKHGAAQTERIRLGLQQVRARWRVEDGDGAALTAFATEHFLSDPAVLEDTAAHLEYALEMLDGHAYEMERELSRYRELDEGPLRPVDGLIGSYKASAHITEDLFKNKTAFVALLNFPITTLEQRVTMGKKWSRERWALARLTGRFEYRLPADLLQTIKTAESAAEDYIDNYNVHMDRLASPAGSAGFPAGKRLISHWGLRDEIRALYSQGADGLRRQRLIAQVMERIIHQQIPAAVISSDDLDWDAEKNLVSAPGAGKWVKADREPDRRYRRLLDVYRAHRQADPYFPTMPTRIDRAFSRQREIPEPRLRKLLQEVLLSPTAKKVGKLIEKRLGRKLEPFDLWYAGFKASGAPDEGKLDQLTRKRYPTAKAFDDDLPRILKQLGFSRDTAAFVADHIVVDSSRGAGHAAGAQRRADQAHLRTRVGEKGMDYKGYNIAIHELGHNVEQVFSMSKIDHTLLEGVPNSGFTEAFAFLFQARDLELLGKGSKSGAETESLRALDRFWKTYEIAGVGLLDTAIWQWMYDHPEATPAQLREATVRIAKDLWNRFYAPVFGVRDVVLPAIYSHVVAYALYTPNYSLGYLITAQVEGHLKTRKLAAEMERMCRLGQLAPDVWMEQAVSAPISSTALIGAADEALKKITK